MAGSISSAVQYELVGKEPMGSVQELVCPCTVAVAMDTKTTSRMARQRKLPGRNRFIGKRVSFLELWKIVHSLGFAMHEIHFIWRHLGRIKGSSCRSTSSSVRAYCAWLIVEWLFSRIAYRMLPSFPLQGKNSEIDN